MWWLSIPLALAEPSIEEQNTFTEWAGFPVVNFSEDRGTGLGALAVLAHHEHGADPYVWRMQLQIFTTVLKDSNGLGTPYQEHQLLLDMPGVSFARLGLEATWARHMSAAYFGQGSQPQSAPEDPSTQVYAYNHLFPNLRVSERVDLNGTWEQFGHVGIQGSQVDVYGDSLLAQEASGPQPPVGLEAHRLVEAQVGLLRDTRVNETWSTQGLLIEGSVRTGRMVGSENGSHVGANLGLRGFLPLHPRYAVLAARLLLDSVHGEVPFYRLDEFGGLRPVSGPGGKDSVRGVPEGSFHTPLKTVGNLELRSRFWYGQFMGQKSSVGFVAFADAGAARDRAASPPSLVTSGGLGARAYLGNTFVLRIDRAFSLGQEALYVTVDELF